MMVFAALAIGMIAASAQPAETPSPPLSCGGDGPFWTLRLAADGDARFSDGDGAEITSRYEIKRSRNTTLVSGFVLGAKREILAVVEHGPCGVTNADNDLPYSILLWYRGELLSGCCSPP